VTTGWGSEVGLNSKAMTISGSKATHLTPSGPISIAEQERRSFSPEHLDKVAATFYHVCMGIPQEPVGRIVEVLQDYCGFHGVFIGA